MKKHQAVFSPVNRGFSLIEALVALVVTAFGMLALAGFQSSLGVASENAKHRAQAVRLAQQKLEQLRAFEQVSASGAKFDYATDVVSGGPETIDGGAFGYTTSNSYTRQWWVTKADGVTAGEATDGQKWIRVRVLWTDRLNQTQNVMLQSVISRAEPGDLGTLAVGPGARQPRTPKNRNVDVPYPAVNISGGRSAFLPPGGNRVFIFDNVSGDVLGSCDASLLSIASLSITSVVDLTDTSLGCNANKAYLLSGYIRFLSGAMPSGNETAIDNALSNPVDATKELSLTVNAPGFASGQTHLCYAQRQKVVSTNTTATSNISLISRDATGLVRVRTSGNHGLDTGQIVSINNVNKTSFIGQYTLTKTANNEFTYNQPGLTTVESDTTGTATRVQQVTLAESDPVPTGYTREISRFVAYACVVYPIDHDGQPSTRALWWGDLSLTPVMTSGDSSLWTLGTTAGTKKVCRFTGDYVNDNRVSNAEHPRYYRGVSGAIDNQNFLVIDGDRTCPTDSKIDPLAGDYINTNTVLHQTSAGSALTGSPSDASTQWSVNGEPSGAPSSITDILPML